MSTAMKEDAPLDSRLEEGRNPQSGELNLPPQRPGLGARKRPSRLQSFRSSSLPLLSPVEIYNRHQKTHDSLHPPIIRPSSVIPEKHPNSNFQENSIPAADKLANFRRLVGIDSSETHIVGGTYNRPAENVGIYMRIVREEVRSKALYKRFSILINTSLGLQIVLAAALTALGAADGSRSAITVFGAINTVLASVLTFLKGSGLPNRENYYATEWGKLREYIEQRERDFGRVDCKMDVDVEIRKIEGMYNEVKQDIEVNTPDNYTSVTQAKKMAGLPTAVYSSHQLDPEKAVFEDGNHLNSATTSMAVDRAPHPVSDNGLGAAIGNGAGLGSGPAGTTIGPPPPPPPPVAPQHSDSTLEKLANRLSGTTATGGAGGLGGLVSSLAGNEKAHHVLDQVTRLSHKLGADGLADRLSHLERSHDQVSRGIQGASGAVGAEAERLATAGREAGETGDRIVRETAGHVGDELRHDAERLRDAGRSVEVQSLSLARDAGAQAERMREGALGHMRSLSQEGEGYFHRMTGTLDNQAARLRAAGSRAQELRSGVTSRVHGGVERAESSARGGMERASSGVQGVERSLESGAGETVGAVGRASEDMRDAREGEPGSARQP